MDEKSAEPKVKTTEKKPAEKGVGTRPAPAAKTASQKVDPADRPFIRAENEDDDGYDPYSDRQPHLEPLFERDPWD
ncbi:MAG: hypothetical protein LKK55_01930 [Olsenella sp.]|jgi:hypothetical protein|nr:hypothetical protein [Olsenella sp.]MCI2183453.1 hypothetical protein [Olsenella sp.]